MPSQKKNSFKSIIFLIPGFLLLALGLLTLDVSVDFIEYHHDTIELLHQIYGGETPLEDWDDISDPFHHNEQTMYFTVFLMTVFSFTLYALVAYFYSKVSKHDSERAEHTAFLERLVAALEASLDGIAIVNVDKNVTFINAALLRTLGFEVNDMDRFLNRDWKILFGGMIDSYLQADIFTTLKNEKSWNGEFQISTKSGQSRILHLSATALKDGGHICTVHDMTMERQVQNEKAELQDQFYQSQKMEAIGRLAGGIAHDFNNILAAINGYAEFLVEDLEGQENLQKFASNILQAGERAKGLVDQMLAFSRRKEGNHEVVNLRSSIKETLSMLHASLPKTIDVKHDIEVEEAYVVGNVSQMTQVLMNLCVNASDAMEHEKGTISIRLSDAQFSDFPMPKFIRDDLLEESEVAPISFKEIHGGRNMLVLGVISKQHNYYCLSIEDTGSGMSRAIMERIFEPFFTTKPVDKGTGLGLAMVHGAISAHRGCMVIDSVLGKGTRFDLYFPAESNHIENHNKEDEAESISFEDMVVLVVEDQEEVRDMIMSLMERIGIDAECAENGVEALAILRENPNVFDLCITDYNMPHMTGLELIKHAGREFPTLPFIILSGYSKDKVSELIEEQPNLYASVRKPISKDKLAKEISEVMARAQLNLTA